jgi:hypothetical protein
LNFAQFSSLRGMSDVSCFTAGRQHRSARRMISALSVMIYSTSACSPHAFSAHAFARIRVETTPHGQIFKLHEIGRLRAAGGGFPLSSRLSERDSCLRGGPYVHLRELRLGFCQLSLSCGPAEVYHRLVGRTDRPHPPHRMSGVGPAECQTSRSALGYSGPPCPRVPRDRVPGGKSVAVSGSLLVDGANVIAHTGNPACLRH